MQCRVGNLMVIILFHFFFLFIFLCLTGGDVDEFRVLVVVLVDYAGYDAD